MRHRSLYYRDLAALFSVLAILLSTSVSLAAHHDDDKTTASDVKQEVMETYDVLKSYTLEQRDEAMATAEDQIERLDAQISRMQGSIDNKWQDMSQATRERTRKTLDELREKREELAEWLGGLRYSSKDAWEEVKKGFADSFDRLERAFTRASKDFDNDKNK
jgi:TolA-binding protein